MDRRAALAAERIAIPKVSVVGTHFGLFEKSLKTSGFLFFNFNHLAHNSYPEYSAVF
jgi:hypothetical protein